LERVAPIGPGWPRHVPAALIIVVLRLLTVSLAGPTAQTRVPCNRATVLLVIDVSLNMQATDVLPSRIATAKDAATQFVRGMPPTINLGVESFAGTSAVLVPPTIDRSPAIEQIQSLKLAESTATGEALMTALNAIDSFNQLIPGSEGGPPPARIVLMERWQTNRWSGMSSRWPPRPAAATSRSARSLSAPLRNDQLGGPTNSGPGG
jgi:Ca-activated chloride channel homolog